MSRKLPSQQDAVEFRREAYELNQSQWAEVLTMSKSHYSEFRSGLRDLPKHAMAKAFQYGVPAECLFQCNANKGFPHIKKLLKLKEPT